MEDSPDEFSCRSYSWDIINEIDKLLEECESDTEDMDVVKPNDLVPASTVNITHHSPVRKNEVEFIGKKRAIFELLEDHEEYGVYEHNPEEYNWTVFYKTLPPGEHHKNIKKEPGTETINGYSTTDQQIKVKIEPDIAESNDLSRILNNTNTNPEHSVEDDEIMGNLWETPLFSNQTSTPQTNKYSQTDIQKNCIKDFTFKIFPLSDKTSACPTNLIPTYSQISKPEIHRDQNVLKQSYSDKGLTFNKNVDPKYSQISQPEIPRDQNVLKQSYSDKGLTFNKNVDPKYSKINKPETHRDQNVVSKQSYSDKGLTFTKNVVPKYSQISKPETYRDQYKPEICKDQNVLKQSYSDKELTSNKNYDPKYSQISEPETYRDQNVVLKQSYSDKGLTFNKNVDPKYSQISKPEICKDQNVLKQSYSDKELTSNKNYDPKYSQISEPETYRDQNVVLKQSYSDKGLTFNKNVDPKYSQISKPEIHTDQNVLKQSYSDKGLTFNKNDDPEYSQISEPEIHRDQNVVLEQSYSDKELTSNKNDDPEYSQISEPEIHRDQNVVLEQSYSDKGITSNKNVDPKHSPISKPETRRDQNVVLEQSYADKGLTSNKNVDPEYSQITIPEIRRDQNVVSKQLYSDKGLTSKKSVDSEYSQISKPEICKDQNVLLKQSYSDKGLTSNKNVDPEYSQNYNLENFNKDKDTSWKTSTSWNNSNPEYSGNYNYKDDCVDRVRKYDTKTNSEFIKWNHHKQHNSSFGSYKQPIRNHQNTYRTPFRKIERGPPGGNKNNKNDFRKTSKKKFQGNIPNIQCLPLNQLRGFNSKSNETFTGDFKISENNQFGNCITYERIDSEKKNLNTGTNNSKNSTFIPESVPDCTFNSFQQHNFPFITTNKSSDTSTKDIANSSLWHGHQNDSEIQNLSTGTNNSKTSTFIPENVPDDTFNNFQQNFPFITTNKSLDTSTKDIGNSSLWHGHQNDNEIQNLNRKCSFIPESVPDYTFNNFQQQNFQFTSSHTSTRDITNSSLWHGHTNDNEIQNLHTGTNNSSSSQFLPESVSSHTFNNFQQNLPFTSTHKPSHTSTSDITNSSLWYGYKNDNEIQNLPTGTNNSSSCQFSQESVRDHSFNNFQQQNLSFTLPHKPSHTLTSDMHRPRHVFNPTDYNKQVLNNLSLWHEHKDDNEVQNLNTEKNNSNSSQFILGSVPDLTCNNFQQPKVPPFTLTNKSSHTSTSDMHRPRHIFDPTDFNKPKQHNQILNTSWTEHRNINNSWKHTDSTKSLYQYDAYSNNYDIIGTQQFYENQLYSNNYDIGRKEVMASQASDQNAMNVSVDDSSKKGISNNEYIIKDYLCPETLVGCTVKFSSRKLANTLIREKIEEILSTHGPLENSWWTPDDLYFITYKTRDLAQYVFKLYPKNTASSY
ncbi:Hypothetical protein CINCED_3A015707 [Cinara cedri]|uniref:Uncharacterized protein n=1 Tax=Cinara cedri TaxID=506608 RepID=A0A5E4ML91_9HEMI|nr:Hypothetical protein CINCED_3A015707 [Cinara cedri]